MLLFKKVNDLQQYIIKQKSDGKTVGFVPTMGALHEGHLSLLKQAAQRNDLSLCSIFVNPTQFNEQKDLKTYPRIPHKDIELLTGVGCDVLFMPEVNEVYPVGLDTTINIDFAPLDEVMEGAFRPGHFKGVAQVVKRLLDITLPNDLYMGQKDFQQLTIIRHMIDVLKLPVNLIAGKTVREADGLAMSSRNALLTDENRQQAPIIYKTLQKVRDWSAEVTLSEIEPLALKKLSEPNNFRPEYFKIVNGYTLQEIKDLQDSDLVVACVAVWAGNVRLIDNIIIQS